MNATNSGTASTSSEPEQPMQSKEDQIKELEAWKAEKLALIKENEAKAIAAIPKELEEQMIIFRNNLPVAMS